MALHHAKGLVLAGQRVTTLLHPQAKTWALARRMGLEVESMSSSRLNPFLPWLLRRRIAQMNVDLVLAQGNRAAYMATRAVGGQKPVVAVAHSTWLRNYPGVTGVVCLTPASRDRLKTTTEGVAFSPNFLTETPVDPPRLLRQPPTIGAMGRLVAKKGMADFIEALALLKHQFIFSAAIAGEGPERDALATLIRSHQLEDRVTLTGWVEGRKFLRELDIFVLPSREEPFGIVALEAWAAGLPVIATACEGPSSYIKHEENGLLIPPQEPAATAAALTRLLRDSDFALNLARTGQATFKAQFGDGGGEVLLRALHQLMPNSSGRNGEGV
jgi:glycosyltransferase involved in cell wall biosynthesis